MRRWAPAAAAAAVVVIAAGGVALARLAGDGGTPAGAAPRSPDAATPGSATPGSATPGSGAPGSGAPGSAPARAATLEQLRVRDGDRVTASGRVLAEPGKPVRFCAPLAEAGVGYPGPERPTPCDVGVTLTGADVDRLTDPKEYRGTRWGQARITGTYRAGTIAVTAQEPPAPDAGADLPIPERPPCPAPPGGWEPGVPDGVEALGRVVEADPDAYGELVVTYPDGPPTGPTAPPGYRDATQVALVTTVLDPATAERRLRAHYSGNLCVTRAVRSRSATDAVWRRVRPESGWREHGVYEGGPDYYTGRATVSLLVVDDAAYRWLADADGGTGIVEASPWLRRA